VPAATERAVLAPSPGARTGAWRGGWWRGALRVRSPHHNARPGGEPVDLVVVHAISLPPGDFGGGWITDLFLGRLDRDAHPAFAPLEGLRVSAHFLIRRDGQVLQYVATDRRAWHAGVSHWRGRDNCNDRSIGIELEGLPGLGFEPAQYAVLARLLRALQRHHPIRDVVGHEHVAPGRKADPGPGFDWPHLRRLLRHIVQQAPLWVMGDPPPKPGRGHASTLPRPPDARRRPMRLTGWKYRPTHYR
jgi:AmpD protein